MSIQANNLLARLTNIFTQSTTSTLYQLIYGIGTALDNNDPIQIDLAGQFSVTDATGSALDSNGADFNTYRRAGESDASYRARILTNILAANLPPTPSKILSIVSAFGLTGQIFEYGVSQFICGVSAMGSFGFCSANDVFTYQLTITNPNNVTYNQSDLETAVINASPVRCTVEFVYQ